ncbi:hypothetical protein [Companilactobacillus jidongensis]|uniref:hypothetical protein n=1 Tax=Companilactobacillus jidongensis TaxID=2486006 RepID=UPI001CDC5F72|nr:hypothetical protein [Companilactobacillus jidongensis]
MNEQKLPVYPAGVKNVESRNKDLISGDQSNGADNWYVSDSVTRQTIQFKNLYSMSLAGNLFIPKSLNKDINNPAIIV